MLENTEVECTLAQAVLESQQAHIAQAEAMQAQAEANQAMAEALKTQAITQLTEQALVVLLVGMVLGTGEGTVLFVIRFQQAEQPHRMDMIEEPGELWSRQVEEEDVVFSGLGVVKLLILYSTV